MLRLCWSLLSLTHCIRACESSALLRSRLAERGAKKQAAPCPYILGVSTRGPCLNPRLESDGLDVRNRSPHPLHGGSPSRALNRDNGLFIYQLISLFRQRPQQNIQRRVLKARYYKYLLHRMNTGEIRKDNLYKTFARKNHRRGFSFGGVVLCVNLVLRWSGVEVWAYVFVLKPRLVGGDAGKPLRDVRSQEPQVGCFRAGVAVTSFFVVVFIVHLCVVGREWLHFFLLV